MLHCDGVAGGVSIIMPVYTSKQFQFSLRKELANRAGPFQPVCTVHSVHTYMHLCFHNKFKSCSPLHPAQLPEWHILEGSHEEQPAACNAHHLYAISIIRSPKPNCVIPLPWHGLNHTVQFTCVMKFLTMKSSTLHCG